MEKLYEKAQNFIMQNGTNTQKTLFRYLIGDETKKTAVEALKQYQNEDGGWANGLEIEYQGNISSPMTTAAALSYLYFFDLGDTKLFTKTLNYLELTQKSDGSWDDSEDILQFEIPVWYGPQNFVDYKTGVIIKWLMRLNTQNQKMYDKAINYLLKNFKETSKTANVWSAMAYINAFSEFPQLKETPEIMEWGVSILKPPTLSSKKKAKFSWPQVQGMIYDDDHMLEPFKEKVIETIKQRQLKNGDWPHRFGVYNKVWAAILIIRFLKINNEL